MFDKKGRKTFIEEQLKRKREELTKLLNVTTFDLVLFCFIILLFLTATTFWLIHL